MYNMAVNPSGGFYTFSQFDADAKITSLNSSLGVAWEAWINMTGGTSPQNWGRSIVVNTDGTIAILIETEADSVTVNSSLTFTKPSGLTSEIRWLVIAVYSTTGDVIAATAIKEDTTKINANMQLDQTTGTGYLITGTFDGSLLDFGAGVNVTSAATGPKPFFAALDAELLPSMALNLANETSASISASYDDSDCNAGVSCALLGATDGSELWFGAYNCSNGNNYVVAFGPAGISWCSTTVGTAGNQTGSGVGQAGLSIDGGTNVYVALTSFEASADIIDSTGAVTTVNRPTSSNPWVLVYALDSSGTLIWSASFGAAATARDILADTTSNVVYITGTLLSGGSLDANGTSLSPPAYFLGLDIYTGSVLFGTSLNSTDADATTLDPTRLVPDGAGNAFFTGYLKATTLAWGETTMTASGSSNADG